MTSLTLPTVTWTVQTTHGPELRTGIPAGPAPEGWVNPPGLVGAIDAQGILHWLGADRVSEAPTAPAYGQNGGK